MIDSRPSFSLLVPLLALLTLATVLHSSSAFAYMPLSPCWVSRHVAEAREAPRSDAKVVELIPINTPLERVAAKGKWRLVAEGWIKNEVCDVEPQTMRTIRAELRRAKSPQQRILALRKWQVLNAVTRRSQIVYRELLKANQKYGQAFSEADLPGWCSLNVDVANLRARPDPEAPISRYAPITAQLIPFARKGQWLRVDGGWVHRSLCAQSSLTAEAATEAAEKAVDRSERIKWLQRRVALEPRDKAAWLSLSEAMLESDAVGASGAVQQKLNGKTYVAQCYRGILRVQGVIEPSGEFRRLLWANNQDEMGTGTIFDQLMDTKGLARREALRLKDDLAKTHWFSVRTFGPPRSRFPGAAWVWPPAQMSPTALSDLVEVSAEGTYWTGLALGSCRSDQEEKDAVYLTTPTEPLQMSGCSAAIFNETASREMKAYGGLYAKAPAADVQKVYCQHQATYQLTEFALTGGSAPYGQLQHGWHTVEVAGERIVNQWVPSFLHSRGDRSAQWLRSIWNPTRALRVVTFPTGQAIFVVQGTQLRAYPIWLLTWGC